MRLVHILTVPESLVFLRGQMARLRALGIEPAAITSPGAQLERFGDIERVAVRGIPMSRSLTPLRDSIALFRLWRHIVRTNPVIVHSHTPKAGMLGMIAATLAGTPVRIYHMRGLVYSTRTGLYRRILMATEKLSCLLAHRVLSVSHGIRQQAIEDRLCPAEKICVLANGSGNGVDSHSMFNPARMSPGTRSLLRGAFGIPEDDLLVGFVGRIVRDKGIVELARAWEQLARRHPNIHLAIIGPLEQPGTLPDEIEKILRRGPRVILTGERDDVPELYSAMDLLVLPTWREGFPNVLLEAAAMSLPVVSTRVPGCIEAVVDGKTGFLVPAADADALASAIETYISNAELRRLHGAAGREWVVTRFSQEPIWDALCQTYLTLLRERS